MSDKNNYLYATARIRALELSFINHDRIERMLSAKTNDEASVVLSECGYGDIHITSTIDLEKIILSQRLKAFDLVEKLAENRNILDIFKIKYDYHNIKTIIKSRDNNFSHLLIQSGRMDVQQLEGIIRESDYYKMNPTMGKAVSEAKEVLNRTQNPQFSDFILDRAAFAEMLNISLLTQNAFIINYVKLLIDINNLRTFIRSYKMNKGSAFLKMALFEGGEIDIAKLIAASDDAIFKSESIYALTRLENAATNGDFTLNGERTLTFFEKVCDDVLIDYLISARYVPYGVEPLFAYLAAKESEFMTVRTIFSGRIANVGHELIRERLRKSYV